MKQDKRRITLVVRHARNTARDWDESNPNQRIIFIDGLQFLQYAIERAAQKATEDLARVIIDRVGSPLQLLDLLSRVPAEFVGDVLLLLEDGTGYLSSTGRGGDRVLYALIDGDVDFYLKTNGLVWTKDAGAKLTTGAAIASA